MQLVNSFNENNRPSLGAPILNDASEKRLLRVICDIGPEAIDSPPEVAIWRADNIRCGHSWLQGLENGRERRMEQLATELSEFWVPVVLFVH